MFLGPALILGALLWARDIYTKPSSRPGYRGPWLMGGLGACVFLFYLWLFSTGAD